VLDYGARWYDPSIARWNAVDPLAEQIPSWSTYQYTRNNPILRIDPDGMMDSIPSRKEIKEVFVGVKDAWNQAISDVGNYLFGGDDSQGGLMQIDKNKKGEQVGNVPDGKDAEVIDAFKTTKYTGAEINGSEGYENATGYFDDIKNGSVSLQIGGSLGKETGNFITSFASDQKDSATHIVSDSEGKPLDTTTVVAIKPRGAFSNLSKVQLKPTPKGTVVKNAKQ